MKTLTIRGIDVELDRAIKSRAQQNNLSANQWILQALKKVTGTGKEPVFKKHTKIFERIDEDVWK